MEVVVVMPCNITSNRSSDNWTQSEMGRFFQ